MYWNVGHVEGSFVRPGIDLLPVRAFVSHVPDREGYEGQFKVAHYQDGQK
jgi:hypothetical protein